MRDADDEKDCNDDDNEVKFHADGESDEDEDGEDGGTIVTNDKR